MKLRKSQFNIRFVTPAFVGDAEQKGAWRTPPFKALLRQWHRVCLAKVCNYNFKAVCRKEGYLFGSVLAENAHKSRVSLRLDLWKPGTRQNWGEKDPEVKHPEVKQKKGIGAHLYMGFGPLTYSQGKGTEFAPARSQAINSDENGQLTIIYPEEHAKEIFDAVQLLHWFGSIGGRSRNGWGSFLLEGDKLQDFHEISMNNPFIKDISRPLAECLKIDWPHALGIDDHGRLLIWRTKKRYSSWSEVMKELAQIKINFRVGLSFSRNQGERDRKLDERHVLAYPVTHHQVAGWEKERLANQIRFKVGRGDKGYFGLIYHLPCCIPKELAGKLTPNDKTWLGGKELNVWKRVHNSLDSESILERL